ncbi:hypothetical protein RvY_06334 [Ramazzottius varieornatus]|uniref:Receptor ligand binding region domain-containing protein n=1 Tax=Ramazzottius varieornatus TaxID=947166 RepID=A0A1D1V3P5_RAMVA|nr:hypothetical protein RvY_06334 [Ramazzottius varieornatus]
MTDGSYVYISSQTTQVPTLGSFTWQNSDVDDEEAYEGFRSVIEVVNPNPDWEKITDIIDLISDTTRAKFNRSMKGDQRFNDLAISVYEAYEVFAAETWRYEVITDRLTVTRPTLAALWVNPTGNPPPDIPRCGFRNDLCHDVASKTTVAASVTAACLLIIVSGLLLSIKFVHARAYDTANQSWWIIDSEKFGRLEGRKRTGNPSFRPSLMPVMQGNPTTCSVSGETFWIVRVE